MKLNFILEGLNIYCDMKNILVILLLSNYTNFVFSQSGQIEYKISPNKIKEAEFANNPESKRLGSLLEEFASMISDKIIRLNFHEKESTSRVLKSVENDFTDTDFSNSLIGGKGNFYFDSDENILLNELNTLGENFIVREDVDESNWKLQNVFKTIKGYKCRLAVRNEIIEQRGKIVEKKYKAWFTDSIPYSFGPLSFVGLQGLVLEVECEGGSLPFKIIVFNIEMEKENIKINKPKKGIRLTKKEYTKMIDNKFYSIFKDVD